MFIMNLEAVIIFLVAIGIGSMLIYFFLLPNFTNKHLRLLERFGTDLFPLDYKVQRKGFNKSKFGYTLLFRKNENDFFSINLNPGSSDFSVVSKEFNVEHFNFNERRSLYFGGNDIGISRISIQLINNYGILEITHSSLDSPPMSKNELLDLMKNSNIAIIEDQVNS